MTVFLEGLNPFLFNRFVHFNTLTNLQWISNRPRKKKVQILEQCVVFYFAQEKE